MTQEHLITPPSELVQQWLNAPRHTKPPIELLQKNGTFVVQKCHSLSNSEVMALAEQAARWGSNQELDACCSWVSQFDYDDYSYGDSLRAARRPKPLRLKEQALTQLDSLHTDLKTHGLGVNTDAIRRALEQLND